MIYHLIFATLFVLTSFANENQTVIMDAIESYDNINKSSFMLTEDKICTYYKDDQGVKVISVRNVLDQSGFLIPVKEIAPIEPVYAPNPYEFIASRVTTNYLKGIVTKNVANVFETQYVLDEHKKVKQWTCIDTEVFFFHHKNFISKVLRTKDRVELRKKMYMTLNVIGEDDSYILRDDELEPLLVVMDNKPYYPILDTDGSIRKIVDPETNEVVAEVSFSEEGHVVSQSGGYLVPFYFKGMWQEKLTDIYFGFERCYDADLKDFIF